MIVRNTFAILLLLATHAVSSSSYGYSCVARSTGKNCGGSYNGYSSSSKGQAIQDALNNCRRSAPSSCTCSLSSCSNGQEQEVDLDDIINPVGEHDHFMGTVTVMPTGTRAYPDVHSEMALLSIDWVSAKEKSTKLVAALENEPVVTRGNPW